MHYKSFNVFIQRFFCKFFLINKFDPAGTWEGFLDGVGFLGKLFLNKSDISITND